MTKHRETTTTETTETEQTPSETTETVETTETTTRPATQDHDGGEVKVETTTTEQR